MKYKFLAETVTITDVSLAKLFAVQEHPGSWCWSRTVAGQRAYTRLSRPNPVPPSSSPSAGRGLLWSLISLALASCDSCGKSPNSSVPSARSWPPPQFLSAQAMARATPPRFHITDGAGIAPRHLEKPNKLCCHFTVLGCCSHPETILNMRSHSERVWRVWMHPWACICCCRAGSGKRSVEAVRLAGILGLAMTILAMSISGGIALLPLCCCSSHVFFTSCVFSWPPTLLNSWRASQGKGFSGKLRIFLLT